MSIVINDFAKKAYQYYISVGMTPEAAVGLMGNQYYESDGFVASRVEYLCIQRLKENGKNYTQDTYYKAVDSGKISRAEFLNPLPNRQYGFGICQWTTPVPRKSELYDRTVGKGLSIADEQAQLEYTVYELKTRYPSVWKTLTTTNSIKTASDTVLRDFEVPANWQSQSATRLSFAQDYYNYFKNQTSAKGSDKVATIVDKAINAVIALAKQEDGYIEKNNANNLDSKTAGAGSGNYTKYWRDLGMNGWQGQPYCAAFISWLFMKVFGQDTAKKLLKHWPFTYCPTLASMTTNKTPKVGSIVLFYRNGEYVHTGYVIGVTDTTVTTAEGNTSGGSTIVANGGQVVYGKVYNRSSLSSYTKYFMPDYSIVTEINGVDLNASAPAPSTTTSEKPWKAKLVRNAKVRTWAGTEYGEVSFSPMKKNTEVEVQYSLKANDGTTWYYFKYENKYAFISAEEVEKVTATTTTTTTATTTTKKTQFRVQAGVYAVKANAKSIKATLKQAGYEPIIVTVNKQYIVQLGMFDNQQNAINLKNQLNADGFDAAVIAIKS